MLNLIWRSSARESLYEILEYIRDRNPVAAERLNGAIFDCADRLAAHPYMHRAGRVAGTREAIVHPNYILVYRVGEDAIEILDVVHARQRYP